MHAPAPLNPKLSSAYVLITKTISFQNAFYTLTSPHCNHLNTEMHQQYSATLPHSKHAKLTPHELQLTKSKTFSSKAKQKKHFQIHLQKCQSLRFQTAESCFQTISNVHEQNLLKNGYIPEISDGRNERSHQRKRNKTDRSLGEFRFEPGMENYVQLQYQQPFLSVDGDSKKENGMVYNEASPGKGRSERKGNREFMPEIVLDVR